MSKSKVEALHFIKENIHFFSAPFLSQQAFAQWVQKTNNSAQAVNLTNKFNSSLSLKTYSEEHLELTTSRHEEINIGLFSEALILNVLQLKPCALLGDDTKLIKFLDKNPQFCKMINEIPNNQALSKLINNWNEDHEEEVMEFKAREGYIKQIDPILVALDALKKKGDNLKSRGEELGFKIKELVKMAKSGISELGPFGKKDSSFGITLLEEIDKEIKKLMPEAEKNRGIKQDLINLAFAILDVLTLGLTMLIPNSSIMVKTDTAKEFIDFKEQVKNIRDKIGEDKPNENKDDSNKKMEI